MNSIKRFLMLLRGNTPTDVWIKKGVKIGSHFYRNNNVVIDTEAPVTIGDNVTLASGVFILTHDASTNMYLGFTKKSPVNIGNYVFIGARTLILPGVNIGNNVIIGAGSIVTKDIPDNSVAVGNPAKVIGTTDAYIEKNKINFGK